MNILIGTSGYAYKEWKGSFYPKDLPATGMLRYYAERFKTVEINNTFYRLPGETMLKNWAKDVPEGFVFVLKASRQITHIKRLQEVEDTTAYLLKTAEVLGDKLGPLLFQLPPFMKKDLPRLQSFLSLIPKEHRAAFEFRHASWFEDDVFAVLRAHNAALCLADADSELEVPFVSTADWGYLRLRREDYQDADLRTWAKRVKAQEWKEAFVFFKHEDAGTGPKLAGRLMGIV